MSSYGWFNLECYKAVVFDIRLDLIGLKGIDGPSAEVWALLNAIIGINMMWFQLESVGGYIFCLFRWFSCIFSSRVTTCI